MLIFKLKDDPNEPFYVAKIKDVKGLRPNKELYVQWYSQIETNIPYGTGSFYPSIRHDDINEQSVITDFDELTITKKLPSIVLNTIRVNTSIVKKTQNKFKYSTKIKIKGRITKK